MDMESLRDYIRGLSPDQILMEIRLGVAASFPTQVILLPNNPLASYVDDVVRYDEETVESLLWGEQT